jgi:DNA-binding CsgD family transcriptional regulator
LYEQGRLTEAQAAASAALDSATDDGGYAQGARAVLARCHIEQGDLVGAESVIATIGRHGSRDSLLRALALDVRAGLRLAQHRPQEALQDALHAGALLEEQVSEASPGSVAWRSTAALAYLALGQPQQARRLVEQELEESRSAGMTRTVIRDLRILGLTLGGERVGLGRLAEAVAVGHSHPDRLEHVRALIDYGAALRRSGRRVEARDPLRKGLDLSHRGGAGMLESRARVELVAAGARPRRASLSGVDSLTTSQRRVAELAAGGLTTRQIAGALFVSPKTVEFHLRHIYSKLGVSSREELTRELLVTP